MTLTFTRRIDAHLHLWDLDAGEYAWLTPEHGALYSTFTAEQARAELDAAEVEAAILVQAEDTLGDTDYLLGVAKENTWVAAVVGWYPWTNRARPRRRSIAGASIRPFVAFGICCTTTPEPTSWNSRRSDHRSRCWRDEGWPSMFRMRGRPPRPGRRPGARTPRTHRRGGSPGQPPVGSDAFGAWHSSFASVAALPNTVAKVSGLTLPGVPFTAEALRPAWDAALDLFGPSRLMYGGDWPISVQFGGYQRAWAVYSQWIGELSAAGQEHILWNTAVETYSLNDPMSRKKRVSKC